MTKINEIRIALENHLATTSPALPAISWPNVPYAPAVDTNGIVLPYLRAIFMPVTRRPVTAGPTPEQRHTGLFMVNVYTPEDKGAAAGMGYADQIMTRFDGSSAIVAAEVIVRIEYSEAKRPLHEPPFYVIPVEISWYSYVPQGA